MTPGEAGRLATAALGENARRVVPMSGGSLNQVWRVELEQTSVVVKHAPPFIASAPDIPLDPSRIDFEARALRLFASDERLKTLTGTVRVPTLIHAAPAEHAIVMEDLGPLRHLGQALSRSTVTPAELGSLGRFIAGLHRNTHNDEELARAFDNRPMQVTRCRVQYESLGQWLAESSHPAARSPAARVLSERAAALGQALIPTGTCLVMGDLWPASVLMEGAHLDLIDWELCHYGRPLQDVAHMAAHLWMHGQRARAPAARKIAEAGLRSFLSSYFDALGDQELSSLWSEGEDLDASVHFAAEILMRTLGPLRAGAPYEDLDSDHPEVRRAVELAIEWGGSSYPFRELFGDRPLAETQCGPGT